MGWQPVAPEFGIGGVIDEKIQIFGKAVPVISTAQGGAASQVKYDAAIRRATPSRLPPSSLPVCKVR